MRRKVHPFHYRVTIIGMLGSGILGMSFVLLGWYAQNKPEGHCLNVVATTGFFMCFLFFGAWAIFRYNVCRCPECDKFMFNWSHGTKGKGKKFYCNQCDIEWDSKVIDDGTG
jgi:hypothetical protein